MYVHSNKVSKVRMTNASTYSPVSSRTVIFLSGGGFSRASSGAPSPDGAPRAPAYRANTTHDDGNYLLYVSVDTVIRGLYSHDPHAPLTPTEFYIGLCILVSTIRAP